MPPIIPDAPWWAMAAVIIVVTGITATTSVWVAMIGTRKRLDKTQADVGEVKEQVKNTHLTNLREDIDSLMRTQERHGRYLKDLDTSLRAVGLSLDRRYELQEKALLEAVEDRRREVAEAIDEALEEFVEGCPIRKHQVKEN